VTALDLDHDGKADVWDYTTAQRRTREELDLNADGRPDVARWFDPRQRVTKETLDLDFDGRVDRVQRYEQGRRVDDDPPARP
jgi:hypothetical protein